jgi:hypothetical protein
MEKFAGGFRSPDVEARSHESLSYQARGSRSNELSDVPALAAVASVDLSRPMQKAKTEMNGDKQVTEAKSEI